MREEINLGEWTEEGLDRLLGASSKIGDTGRRIEYLSRQFLGVPYGEATLKGDRVTPEVFVVNLNAVDCFTFLDYVEAMRLSASFRGFTEALKRVRYREAAVAFSRRNHFFTDWAVHNGDLVRDVTGEIGGRLAVTAAKALNRKEDGTCFIAGLQVMERAVTYVPSEAVRDEVRERMKTGDYVGVYSPLAGLDVSHVGIVVRDGGTMRLRHASIALSHRRVIDEDFVAYMAGKAGIVVLRTSDVPS